MSLAGLMLHLNKLSHCLQRHPTLGCNSIPDWGVTYNQPAPLPVQVPAVVLGKVTENGLSNWTPATQKGDLDVGTGT